MVVVDDSPYLRWEVKEWERLSFEKTRDVCMEMSERLDGGQYTCEIQCLKKDCASGRQRLAAYCGDHDSSRLVFLMR